MTADKGSEFVRVRRDALQRARDTAMEWTVRGRIPECGEFGGIAQDLDAMLSAAPPAESHPQGVEAVAWVYDFYGPQFTDNPDTAELARQEGCNVRPLIYAHPPAAQIAAPDHIADARKMVAAPGDTWPATEADEAAMAQADDAGNPAWWRGHDEACTILCQKVNAILDGRDSGRGVANEPWESTRRRLLALVAAPGDVEQHIYVRHP